MRRLVLPTLFILSVLLGAHQTARAASFTFTPIDVPFATDTEAFGINPGGQVVGGYFDKVGVHGFLDDRGVFTPIDVPFATDTEAFGINPGGQVVGAYFDKVGLHGFLATPRR